MNPKIAQSLARIYSKIEWNRSCGSYAMGMMIPPLVFALDAHAAVEIGVANAFTSQILALSLAANDPDALLVSCDINEQACSMAGDAAKSAGIRFHALHQDSRNVEWGGILSGLGIKDVEIAVIDGDHLGETPTIDVLAVAQVIAEFGVMLIHDYGPGQPDVVRAVHRLEASGWQELFLPEIPGDPGNYAACIVQRPRRGAYRLVRKGTETNHA